MQIRLTSSSGQELLEEKIPRKLAISFSDILNSDSLSQPVTMYLSEYHALCPTYLFAFSTGREWRVLALEPGLTFFVIKFLTFFVKRCFNKL